MATKWTPPDLISQPLAEIHKRLEKVFRDLERRMKEAIGTLKADGGVIDRSAFNIRKNRELIEQLQAEIMRSGYGDAIELEIKKLDELSESIIRQAKDLGLENEFSAISNESIKTLIQGTRQSIAQHGLKVASDLETILMRSLTGNVEIRDVMQSIEQTLDVRRDQALALATNHVSSYNRQVKVEHAMESGVDWFIYSGPRDPRNRPFCAAFVGTRVTLDILREHADSYGLDPKAGPVEIALGGFGCRHDLVPLPPDDPEYPLDDWPVGPR